MEDLADIEVEDVRQSVEYGRYMEKIGWEVINKVFIRRLGPVSIAKIQRTNLPKELDKVLKDNRVFMCKFEPAKVGHVPKEFRQDGWPMLGTKTIRVDLRPSEKKILESFKKDCRYILRKFQDTKYKIQTNEFRKFYEIWKRSAKRKNLWIPNQREYEALVQSFGDECFCKTINDEAGAVILTHKASAFYYYAGSTIKSDLPYLAVWEAMKEAKMRGAKVWDFEGIYDSRWPNKGWVGFSHFKKSFGGVEVEYPGCFSKWRWPF